MAEAKAVKAEPVKSEPQEAEPAAAVARSSEQLGGDEEGEADIKGALSTRFLESECRQPELSHGQLYCYACRH